MPEHTSSNNQSRGDVRNKTCLPQLAGGRRDAGATATSHCAPEDISVRTRGHLPHWEGNNACYFVTFRMADSIPADVAKRVESERESIVQNARQLGRDLSLSEKRRLARVATIEKYLDSGAGACHLAKPQIAWLIADALQHFDGNRYRLFGWCIMPNHVHVLFEPLNGSTLESVLHAWKSYTAKRINSVLGLQGTFWQREYYDHLIRNDDDFERVVRYIAENPAKAGLQNWPWLWVQL